MKSHLSLEKVQPCICFDFDMFQIIWCKMKMGKPRRNRVSLVEFYGGVDPADNPDIEVRGRGLPLRICIPTWHLLSISPETQLLSTSSLTNLTCVSHYVRTMLPKSYWPLHRSSFLIAMVFLYSAGSFYMWITCLPGVLWSGDHLFPGTVETLEFLRSKGSLRSNHSEAFWHSTRQKDCFCDEQLY